MWESLRGMFSKPERPIFEPPETVDEFEQMDYHDRDKFQRDFPEAYSAFVEAERERQSSFYQR